MAKLTDHQPPPRPWTKGQHDTHDVVVVKLEVCVDKYGRVFSTHQLETDEDIKVTMTWPSGGQRQVAHSLLVEALRREATLTLLVKMTQDEDYLTKLKAMESEARDAELEKLATAMLTGVGKTSHRMAKDIVRDALDTMS